MKKNLAILTDVKHWINYVNAIDRLLPVPTYGLHRKHPFLYQFFKEGRFKTATIHHLSRIARSARSDHHLQFCGRWAHEFLTNKNRHCANCRRRHPLPTVLENDLSTAHRSERNSPTGRGTVYRSTSNSSCSGPLRLGCSDDLLKTRRETNSDGRCHHDRMGSNFSRVTPFTSVKKDFWVERHHGTREIDGTDFSSDIDPNVLKRREWIYGSQSYALTVSYFGLPYYGWQKTRSGPSIQEELELALSKILHETVTCEAASRTDRGVHAAGQVVQFYTNKQPQIRELQRALNGTLPRTIRVTETKAVHLDFHPTLDAKNKTYHYQICNGPAQDLFQRHTSWHYPEALDLEKMRDAASQWIGTHDFTPFTTKPQKNTLCTLLEITIIPLAENRLQITLTGDRFLYKMARRLSGTLADIGAGKIVSSAIGVTAPPHGLSLNKINYSE